MTNILLSLSRVGIEWGAMCTKRAQVDTDIGVALYLEQRVARRRVAPGI